MTVRALLAALLVAAALPAAASATPVADVVLDELTAPIDVGIDEPVIAYTRRVGARGVEVVVRDRDRPVRRLAAGRGSSPVDVGRDRRGGRVVVYQRCRGRCELVAFSLAAVRSRVVVPRVAGVRDLTVGRGRVFWADGRQVRSRSLDGGAVRREAVAPRLKPTELDTDGTTLAVTGELPSDYEGASGLSVTRVGSGRARLRAERQYSEEFAIIRTPVVTRAGVTTLFDQFDGGIGTTFLDFAAGARGYKERTTGGMHVQRWAADGARAVLIEAPGDSGCEIGSLSAEQTLKRVPCRIVRAELSRERLLAPRIAIDGRTATVLRTTLDGATVTGRIPVAGVAVEVRDGAKLVATLKTDARGKVTLPVNETDGGMAVTAATTPRSYAYYPGV